MAPSRIAVVGSINADLVLGVERLPHPGATVAAGEPTWLPGGKGANQAVAAARAGAQVQMHGAVGRDDAGRMCRAALETAGVDTQHVREVDLPTGIAVVAVEQSGENLIMVSPGANSLASADLDALRDVGAVLMQHEIPEPALVAAARACTGLVVLNAAPVRPLGSELADLVDVLVLNQHEDAAYGHPQRGLVVVTAGADDAVVRRDGVEIARARPPRVDVVDTVGAGDAFTASFTVALLGGADPQAALSQAVRDAALATTTRGAQGA